MATVYYRCLSGEFQPQNVTSKKIKDLRAVTMNVLNTSSIHCVQFSVDKPGMSLLMLKVLYTGCSNVFTNFIFVGDCSQYPPYIGPTVVTICMYAILCISH